MRSTSSQERLDNIAGILTHSDIVSNWNLDSLMDDFIKRAPIRMSTFALSSNACRKRLFSLRNFVVSLGPSTHRKKWILRVYERTRNGRKQSCNSQFRLCLIGRSRFAHIGFWVLLLGTCRQPEEALCSWRLYPSSDANPRVQKTDYLLADSRFSVNLFIFDEESHVGKGRCVQ
jgi:hypothetical protein